jgi:ribosome maturation factor RimP
MIERLLSDVLEQRFSEEDLNDCFLVDIVVKKNDRIEVYIESDTTLTIDSCRKVSRFLEKQIEENRWLGEKYTLDVSSPGVDNPIKLARQYVKNVGRNIRVEDNEGVVIEGKLVSANEEKIEVEPEKQAVEERLIENIKKAIILVSFK